MRRRLFLQTLVLLALAGVMAIAFFSTHDRKHDKPVDPIAIAKVTLTSAVAVFAAFRFAQAIYRSRGGLIDRRRYTLTFTPDASFQIGPIEGEGQCTVWVECRDMQLDCVVWDVSSSHATEVATEVLDASSESKKPAALTYHQPKHGRFRIAITLEPEDFHTPVHRNFQLTRRKFVGDTRGATVTVEIWGYARNAKLPIDATPAAYDHDGALKL